jgi:SPP1 gp7 family putative phage head morphogenesis protein
LEEFLNYRYLPLFGEDDLFFCFDDPSPRMEELKAQVDTAYVNAGILKPNEVRIGLGYEATQEGELLRGPSVSSELAGQLSGDHTPAESSDNATPTPELETEQEIKTNPALTLNGAQIAEAMNIVGAVSRGELPRDSGIGSLVVLLNLTEQQAQQIMGPVGRTFFAATPEQAQEQIGKMQAKARRKPRPVPINQDLAKVARKHFAKWEQAMLASLGKASKGKAFRPMKTWGDALAKDAIPYIEITYRTGAEQILSDVGASEDKLKVVNPLVRKYAEKAAYKFAKSTMDSVTGQVNDALASLREQLGEGLEAGERMTQLTARVKEIFGGLSDHRAELIAKTESASAYTQGHIAGAKASGVVKGFVWLTTDAPCPECEAMNGRKFGLNDDVPMPLHPGCLCVLLDDLED